MKNQDDIGNAVATYYGDAAGRQLTTLLKDHIAISGDIVKAAMANDNAGVKAGDDRWHQNAAQIADFLSKANPNCICRRPPTSSWRGCTRTGTRM